MKATKKSQAIEDYLRHYTQGKTRQELMDAKECATCSTPNLEFRDKLSVKEYTISQMCQDCQDKVFGVDDE